jgi:hypothetical protein
VSFLSPNAARGAESFAAGFVDAPEDDSLDPGATPDARNAVLLNVQILPEGSRRAILGKRRGSRPLSMATMGTGKAVDLFEFRREAAASPPPRRCWPAVTGRGTCSTMTPRSRPSRA